MLVNNGYPPQELGDAIQLANEALQLSKDSYESYYARAQAKRKGG